MNTWQPQPTRPFLHHQFFTGVLVALGFVTLAVSFATRIERPDEPGVSAFVSELHDARSDLRASADDLRKATAALEQAARTHERRATMVNILDIAPPPAAAPATAPAGDDLIRCEAPGRCKMSRVEVERLLGNPRELVHEARLMPSVRDGQTRGFKAYGIRGGGLLHRLGFKNGDLITAVNGLELTSPEVAMAVYSKVRRCDQLSVAIERKGQAQQLDLTFD